MPELMAKQDNFFPVQTRTRAPSSSIKAQTGPEAWYERASSRLGALADSLVQFRQSDPLLGQLAWVASNAKEAEEVRQALVRLAGKASRADRVELFRDRGGRSERRLACWPSSAPAEPFAQASASPRGPIFGSGRRVRSDRPRFSILHVPLRAGDSTLATLRLTGGPDRAWSGRLVRRLETFCDLASLAERALASPLLGEAGPTSIADSIMDAELGPRGSAMLAAFLSFALALAHRRREPLSLLIVAVDRLATLHDLLGEEIAELAVDRVARSIKSSIRASDVLARLEDGRLAVILPNASAVNAGKVAESLKTAIARAGAASTSMPTLTASIGVATFPDHAQAVAPLRAAASTALARAKSLGHDRIAAAFLDSPVGL